MRTEILPGYSPKNRDWAEAVRKSLGTNTHVVYWPHWSDHGCSENWIDNEVKKFNQSHEGQELNIVAKSIGTFVAMKILGQGKVRVNKLILCGIPVKDLEVTSSEAYKALLDFPPDKLMIIQNTDDTHGSISDLREFLPFLSSNVNVVVKPRDDHEYPYTDDFSRFLTTDY